MKDSQKLVLIIMGPQGSGKGTQAEMLVEDFGFVHIETGGLLRKAAKKNTPHGRELKNMMNKGSLVPMKYAVGVLEEQIKKNKFKPILIDGSPRQISEAKALEKILRKYDRKISKILYIDISGAESLKRLLLRKRADDTTESIKKRLTWTKEKVTPAVNYYKQKYPVIRINGAQSKSRVYQDIKKSVKDLF